MAILYKLWKKKFIDKSNQEQVKYFANKLTLNTVDERYIAKMAASRCRLSPGDFLNALDSMVWAINECLSTGKNVNLRDLGTFSVSITSNQIDSPEDLSKIRVKAKRVIFRQSRFFTQMLKEIEFKHFKVPDSYVK